MTAVDKTKEQDKKRPTRVATNARGQKNSLRRVILGFTVAFGLVIYFVIAYKGAWLGTINRLDPFYHHKYNNAENNDLIKQESASADNNTDEVNGCFPKNVEQLLRFAPDEEDLDLASDDGDLNPYDQEVKETTSDNTSDNIQVVSSVNLINNLNDYRIYLANVSEFLYKFSKNQPYSENLDIITQIQLPKEFEEIIEMCKSYNDMLLGNDASYKQIPLFDTNIFNKFLKIREKTDSYKEMEKLKVKIENKIDLFVEYAFSLDLQAEFLE